MLIEAAGEQISAVNAAAKLSKLLQISGGALYTDTREVVEFDVSPRLNTLMEVLDETIHKVIVFIPFRHTIELVSRFLTKEGVVNEIINGDVPARERAEIINRSVAGPALQLSTQSEVIKKVTKSIKESFGCEPVFMWEGASIPIVTKLSQTSGAEPLLVGFGLEEDQIHAPNESFSLEQFEMGYRYVTGFLSSL
jgi:acetylornithine deacetylase/succinyl-diaminopimelate desuccinylase-like protein